jgi:hypothetical protein
LCFTIFLHFPVLFVAGSRFLRAHPDFQGSTLLTERDSLFEFENGVNSTPLAFPCADEKDFQRLAE